MKTDELAKLIKDGETLTVEFKGEKRRQLADREIYETVVGLANAKGGMFLIGVEDDGTVTGAFPRHGDTTNTERLEAAIYNNTVPPVSSNVSLVRFADKNIIIIRVSAGYPGICATREGKCMRRIMGVRGPECVPFFPHEHEAQSVNSGAMDYTAEPVGHATIRDMDPLEIERLRQNIRQHGGEARLLDLSDEELLKALGMVVTSGDKLRPNMAGLLLVGRVETVEKCIPTHQVAFQVLDSKGSVSVNDWFRDPILKTLEQIESRFRNLNKEQEAQVGLIRLPIPDYSPDSFREAVINAMQHRNYALLNNVYIQLHPDHLFIANPGSFPEGITLDNLLIHEPKPRNAKLSEILRRIGLVETTGRGIDKIYLGQLKYGRGVPEYSRSDSEAVRVVLSGGKESAQFAVFVAEQEKSRNPLTLDELLVFDHLRHERRIDSAIAGKLTQRGTSNGRVILERLNENEFIEARGEKRGRVYHLSASLYKKLGLKSGYVHTKGFDRIQQETMVFEYLQANIRITRKEVAELCHLSDDQAFRLLSQLAKAGKLKRNGLGRTAYYETRTD